MPQFTRAIHLRFHFAGTNTTQDDTYNPKIYVRSNWTPPHWTLPPVVMTNLFALPNTRLATTSTATGLPRLPMRQKPWAGNHRTR